MLRLRILVIEEALGQNILPSNPRSSCLRIMGPIIGRHTSWQACVYIHNFRPYFFVGLPYEFAQSLDEDSCATFVLAFQKQVERETGVVFQGIEWLDSSWRSFYGYHQSEPFVQFLKLTFESVKALKKVNDRLLKSIIVGDFSLKFQIYEAHIPYHLRFLLDFGYVGCGLLELPLEACTTRALPPRHCEGLKEMLQGLAPTCAPRTTWQSFELDISAQKLPKAPLEGFATLQSLWERERQFCSQNQQEFPEIEFAQNRTDPQNTLKRLTVLPSGHPFHKFLEGPAEPPQIQDLRKQVELIPSVWQDVLDETPVAARKTNRPRRAPYDPNPTWSRPTSPPKANTMAVSDLLEFGCLMSFEILVQTKGQVLKNPARDVIFGISCWIHNEVQQTYWGQDFRLKEYGTEKEMVQAFCTLVADLNPAVMVTFDYHNVNFLVDRVLFLGIQNYLDQLGAFKCAAQNLFPNVVEELSSDSDPDGTLADLFDKTKAAPPKAKSRLVVPGRRLLAIQHLLRKERNLSITNVWQALHSTTRQVHSRITLGDLTRLIETHLEEAYQHLRDQAQTILKVLEAMHILPQYCEMCRIYGVDLSTLIHRGSQIRVEFVLCRWTKHQKFLLLTGSQVQVEQMRSCDHIPMVLEPDSRFQWDPVAVFDFQSLYPSLIIAYNLCFSTCLGRHGQGFAPFGMHSLRLPPDFLDHLDAHEGFVTPNQCLFTAPSKRQGILPEICRLLLKTRLMLKESQKFQKFPRREWEQLSIKLLMNVIYGYTGASFSGRMPCIELADAIVSTARRSLERAMQVAEGFPGCSICYGDTDSLFVLMKGRTLQQAFDLAALIREAVNRELPSPVELKLEKIYWPSIMATKKRYCGKVYVSPQSTPQFECKGLEVIRRDQCGLTQRVCTRVVWGLFSSFGNLSQMEDQLVEEFWRIHRNQVDLAEFVYTRDVRGSLAAYASVSSLPPAAAVRVRAQQADGATHNHETAVDYVITSADGGTLADRAASPSEIVKRTRSLDYNYYLMKAIGGPLGRLLELLQRDGLKMDLIAFFERLEARLPKKIQSQHFHVVPKCKFCGQKATGTTQVQISGCSVNLGVFSQLESPKTGFDTCDQCANPPMIQAKYWQLERDLQASHSLCLHCCGSREKVCLCQEAWYCSNYSHRHRILRDIEDFF